MKFGDALFGITSLLIMCAAFSEHRFMRQEFDFKGTADGGHVGYLKTYNKQVRPIRVYTKKGEEGKDVVSRFPKGKKDGSRLSVLSGLEPYEVFGTDAGLGLIESPMCRLSWNRSELPLS